MELWDLYDKDGNKTGEVWERKPMNYLNIPEGRYHIVGDILVKHVDGTFLLTKRDMRKDIYPGCWEPGAGGAAQQGEEPYACAVRELFEETGLTADSMELAAHAESLGVDAIAAIPPIYFHLPDRAMAKYWNDISSAAPNTDFIIYNIPQLAGVALSSSLLRTMLKNPRVIGVKNSSMPVQDIEMWRDEGAIVFNGPDEQLLSGLAAGAVGGIGGTYAAMPELYLKIYELTRAGKIVEARAIQDACCQMIYRMCSGQGNMYAMIKAIIREMGGPDVGGVRAPLFPLQEADLPIAKETAAQIKELIAKYC